MSRPRDDRQKDLLRAALDAIIDLGHPLVRLAEKIDGGFLDGRFGSVCVARASLDCRRGWWRGSSS
jgi:IS5 family transposase